MKTPPALPATVRTRAVIGRELDAARAELRRLGSLAEADGIRHRDSVAARERVAFALRRRIESGELPAEEAADMIPIVHAEDAGLHKAHHRAHYLVARLETELASKPRTDSDPL